METVPLRYCEYHKPQDGKAGWLGLASEFFAGGFPTRFLVESHYTGKTIEFIPVGENDPLFDQDGWDGEMSVYRPVKNLKNVDHLVIYHAY